MLMQNWGRSSLLDKMTELSARRKLDDLTIGPVLTVRMPTAQSVMWRFEYPSFDGLDPRVLE